LDLWVSIWPLVKVKVSVANRQQVTKHAKTLLDKYGLCRQQWQDLLHHGMYHCPRSRFTPKQSSL